MKNEVRPIDANSLARNIREYMDNFPHATTRLAACRAVLSMIGDEGQPPTITAHIDRKEWEPCEVCSCIRIIFRATAVPDFPSGGADFTGYARFCPKCGRCLAESTKED